MLLINALIVTAYDSSVVYILEEQIEDVLFLFWSCIWATTAATYPTQVSKYATYGLFLIFFGFHYFFGFSCNKYACVYFVTLTNWAPDHPWRIGCHKFSGNCGCKSLTVIFFVCLLFWRLSLPWYLSYLLEVSCCH